MNHEVTMMVMTGKTCGVGKGPRHVAIYGGVGCSFFLSLSPSLLISVTINRLSSIIYTDAHTNYTSLDWTGLYAS